MADSIRILVATDNHVGAHERDSTRGDDSWRTFHEIMELAKERDVDMVLLAGDLFHDNKPSRKSMYNVMRSLRLNCLGDKPCELQMLSDESEHFDATFDHVNYEDQNINVSIPVFSIHGNHDDPSGQGHFAALDILAVSGLINYYGKTPQSDNISVKPVLIQKGSTKLALYGLSNVRDERLYRTFRDKKVVFHRPGTQMKDWYNLICVHQNHHAFTETSYLPENFLPDFLDLVIWGHEHECLIEPLLNSEMNFHVMQPGSSVATSLIPGEAKAKNVAIVTITGREMHSEPIRLKTVRPFVYKDLELSSDKKALSIASKKEQHRTELTQYLIGVVNGMIEEARAEWEHTQSERSGRPEEQVEFPLPLIRLRVETTSFDGITKFDLENPQRFSNRFIDKVANTNDVVQFHVKKKNAAAARLAKDPEADQRVMAKIVESDNFQVDNLVKEFLEAQALTILPQNHFGDAVNQYVVKDDKHAMELFVNEALATQIKSLVQLQADTNEEDDDVDLATHIREERARLEELFSKGLIKRSRPKLRPQPDDWNEDFDGPWEEQPEALIRPDEQLDAEDDLASVDETPAPRSNAPARGRGRGRGGSSTVKATSTRKPAATTTRSRKRAVEPEEDDEDEDEGDVVMMDDDDDDHLQDDGDSDSQAIFFSEKRQPAAKPATSSRTRSTAAPSSTRGRRAPTSTPATRKPPARAAAATTRTSKQATLNFTASQASILGNGSGRSRQAVSEDIEDDDDDDAFEPVSTVRSRR